MSSPTSEAMSSEQTWKGRSGKTKRGSPTGRREVVEKYRSLGPDALNCHDHEQHKVGERVHAWGFTCKCQWCESFAKKDSQRLKREHQCRSQADADEFALEVSEQEAHREPSQLASKEQEAAEEQAGAADAATATPALARAWARSLRASPSIYRPAPQSSDA